MHFPERLFSGLFQSTSSIQRKTGNIRRVIWRYNISIHFLYTEEDTESVHSTLMTSHFNPLPLYRGRLCKQRGKRRFKLYFNPLPLYRGRRNLWNKLFCVIDISIHFLYTEEDSDSNSSDKGERISIHFLYTEEDRIGLIGGIHIFVFQSTSSIQRKTVPIPDFLTRYVFQSTSSIQRKTKTSSALRILSVFQSTSSIQRKTLLVYCQPI